MPESSDEHRLTPRQRAYLRSQAHHLKPIHYVGREGLTPAALKAVEEVFNHKELLKLKVQDSAPVTAQECAQAIPEQMPGVEHVQTIGKTVVLFRRHPTDPEIELP